MAESFEAGRKPQVVSDIHRLDEEMEKLINERRRRRTTSGFVSYQQLPTSLLSPETLELEGRINVVIAKRDVALREYATLV
jgi:hypothetical protein